VTLAHPPSPLVHTKAQGNRSTLASTPSPFTDITPTTAPPGAAVSQLKMTGNEQNMHTWCFLSFFLSRFPLLVPSEFKEDRGNSARR